MQNINSLSPSSLLLLQTGAILASAELATREYAEVEVPFSIAKADLWKVAATSRDAIKAKDGVFFPCNTWANVRAIGHYMVLMATSAAPESPAVVVSTRLTPAQRMALVSLLETGYSNGFLTTELSLVRKGLAKMVNGECSLTDAGLELAGQFTVQAA